MLVKVARLGTAVQELALTDGQTVNDALVAADLTVENEISVSTTPLLPQLACSGMAIS